MQSLQKITSRFIPLRIENVDTDQIIPARFLKATTKLGFGKKLLKFCEQEAKKLKYDEIFILTTQSEHWFAEKGFKEKSKELMPTLKKQTYQSERNSKYLTKKL